MNEQVLCSLCGSDAYTERAAFKGSSRRYTTPFEYGRCAACRSLQRLTPVEVDYSDYITSKNLQKTKAKRLARYLHTHGVEKDTPLLDYGCGNGSFLRSMQAIGFSNVQGFEPFNPTYAVMDLERKNQLVYLIHVFEHLPDLEKFFADLDRAVARDGRVLVITPSSSRMQTLDPNDPYQHFALHAPYHNFIPSDEKVIDLFRARGYRLLSSDGYDVARSGYFANNNFSAQFQYELGGAKEDLMASPWPKSVWAVLRNPIKFSRAWLIDTKDTCVSTFLFGRGDRSR